MKLRKLIEELNLFERKRTPTEVRILVIATYIQLLQQEELPKSSQKFTSFSHDYLEVDKEV